VLGAGDVTLAGEEKKESDSGASSKKKEKAAKGNIASFFTKPKKGGKGATEEEDEDTAAKETEAAEPAKKGTKKKSEAADSASAAGSDQAIGNHFGPRALSVRFGLKGDDNKEHNGEGRCVTVEYEHIAVVSLYVPNSGQQLERLSYRLEKWNPSLQEYVKDIENSGKPVVSDFSLTKLPSCLLM
jgi:exonuclease III